MGGIEWAKNEIELACENEDGYGRLCYRSALKAYESLINDGHSGMSWGITRNILIRLMNSKPLKPIEDVPEVWHKSISGNYQCTRMSSLFKQVSEDGTVTYDDVDRVVAYDINSGIGWHNSSISNMINDMFPISMPYYPPTEPYSVYFEQFSDYKAILYFITPQKERINVNHFFKYVGNKIVDVTKEEFYKRKEEYDALQKEKQ